jgi:2-keto-4-pentenoate hydratase/2-oxohepta-3-ene-1,7-dioic acid hydratase in catechol pathway
VILTGTPHGVGPLKEGDEVQVEIDGIGTLINPVKNFIQRKDSSGVPVQ